MKEFPKKALDNHIVFLGKTGSGKTTAAKGIIETLLDQDKRCVIIDPTGAWYGLRSTPSGKRGGYSIAIFGGKYGDFPLSANHGEALGELVATTKMSAIVDTSALRTRERTVFFRDFAESLLRKNENALHLVVDEAHLFAPQGKVASPQAGEMLAAANDLISLGRSRGLRIMLISQRPAKLHKDSLTQVETMVAMRLIAPQDRKAVREWIEDNADADQGQEIITSLAKLKTGEGWVWAPELDILERYKFPMIRTYDSSSAPKSAKKLGQHLAKIDEAGIRAKLAAVSADAVANDPKTLKARIAELERTLKAPQVVSKDALKQSLAAEYDKGYQRGALVGRDNVVKLFRDDLAEMLNRYKSTGTKPLAPMPVWRPEKAIEPGTVVKAPKGDFKAVKVHARRAEPMGTDTGEKLGGMAAKSLAVLAAFPEGMPVNRLCLLAGYRYSGGYRNALAALRTKGYIEGSNSGTLRITQAGQAQGPFEDLPQGDDLIAWWRGHSAFGKMARETFDVLVRHPDTEFTGAELAEKTGYEFSGGFRNALASLRTAGVMEGTNKAGNKLASDLRS